MRRFYLNFLYITIALSIFGSYACKNPVNKYTSPKGYDFNKPEKFKTPSSLLEISGIAFYNGNSDTVYSIQDEDGKLFRQKWGVPKQYHMKFATKGDFEDLAIFKETVFVLKSNGTLYSFPFSEAVKKSSDKVKERKKLVPKGEYEGLYADIQNNKIYVLCKKCDIDKQKEQVTGYIFDYKPETDNLSPAGTFKLNLNQIKALDPKLKPSLRPSALARNIRTNEWYVLSSTNKMLLVTDANWRIKEAHRLNSSTFNQPEGIAFDNAMNLYISNEGDEITDGNILKFRLHK
ncbi:MAG: SdiA-regulated domain-containing protein [Candidatus Pedobacter colombiensis]|uniref:SdiA-regulated domain-containing protein n=1 Tax=Candidatus Pedobacter colombiensis TaxID=3121371 RepID=A0AAJ6B5I2_9SPHI|nr:SdiA-regulated domain-containing protein [Pedobacter sp.]WEK17506.1 MAG: SdiA-regulated domain-containing protein [Pedobacter sp.]